MSSLPVVCHPRRGRAARCHERPRGDNFARDFIEVKLHHVGISVGQRRAAPTPRAGQIAPRTDRRCRSVGQQAVGPRSTHSRPHWRTRPFFWPGLASSWGNQISTGVVSGIPRDELSARAGSFLNASTSPLVLSRMARPGADVREAELLQKLSDASADEIRRRTSQR